VLLGEVLAMGRPMNLAQLELLEQSTCDAAAAFPCELEAQELPRQALQTLAEALECTWATYWKVEVVSMTLRAAVWWSNPAIADRRLRTHTLGRKLSMSEGTAGHVWRSQKPVWSTDLLRDMCLPRSLDARHAGLQGGVWFAVKADSAVYGVVELLAPIVPASSDVLLEAAERLGSRLGSLLAKPMLH
jgi:hypothetical protein